MMDFSNREDMGFFLQKYTDSILFPLVADLFLIDKDYPEAEEICETGLNHHPDNPDGLFILAQIQKEKKDYKKAEKTLKRLLSSHTVYPEALMLLSEVQEQLNRSLNTVKAVKKKYERFDYSFEYPDRKMGRKKKKANNRKIQQPISSTDLKPLKVSPKLATFTLVEILENQGLYPQAMDVLDMLEEKDKDKKKLTECRNRILKKFHTNK